MKCPSAKYGLGVMIKYGHSIGIISKAHGGLMRLKNRESLTY